MPKMMILIAGMMVASVEADDGDLARTLGLDRRVGFASVGPELAPFSYGRPMETIAVPDKLVFPLQATNEALTFYAAYRARNYRAMAAVGAMSAWGGTLRKGIDAVTGAGETKNVSPEDLAGLTEPEIVILGYLWHTDGRTGHELYQEVSSDYVSWKDLARVLDDMVKEGLVVREKVRSRVIYTAAPTPAETRRAVIASRDPERIKAVLLAMNPTSVESGDRESRESRSTGDGVEAD